MYYYLGLGSNLGDRESHLRKAIALLDAFLAERVCTSGYCYTEPWGYTSAHPYCNVVVLYHTALEPTEMLTVAQRVEQQMGRQVHSEVLADGSKQYADREIDIDLLYAYDEQGKPVHIDTQELTIPHPHAAERDFVQDPMHELLHEIADIPFIKMHGLGNDYIYFDCTADSSPSMRLLHDPSYWAERLCDRHRSIGSDGLVFILPSTKADICMRIFNADGSEAEMCGNASRCVALYAATKGLTDGNHLTLETKSGIRRIQIDGATISVSMGHARHTGELAIDGRRYYCMDIGNPHAVHIVEGAKSADGMEYISAAQVREWGQKVECDAHFPQRTNVEYCSVLDAHHIRMRVWERGSGETQACGTGATAAACACIEQGLCASPVEVELLGGKLTISVCEDEATMSGDAHIAYSGIIHPTIEKTHNQ